MPTPSALCPPSPATTPATPPRSPTALHPTPRRPHGSEQAFATRRSPTATDSFAPGYPLGVPVAGPRPRPLLPRRRLPLPGLAGRPTLAALLPDTGAYCKARAASARRRAGPADPRHRPASRSTRRRPRWTWNGRPVKVVDGTTAVHARHARPTNGRIPSPRTQKAGLGFPLAAHGGPVRPDRGHRAGCRPRALPGQADGRNGLVPQPCSTTWNRATCCWPTATTAPTGRSLWYGNAGRDLVTRLHQAAACRLPPWPATGAGRPGRDLVQAASGRTGWTQATYARLPTTGDARSAGARSGIPGFRTQVAGRGDDAVCDPEVVPR